MAGSPGVILESAQQADGGSFLHFRDALGRRCAVYARLAIPSGAGPFAAVIHCPGGGQTINDGDLAFLDQPRLRLRLVRLAAWSL